MIRFASVCSGIGAPEYAWRNLGWHPVFMSEIEAFPRAVLEHHYPGVPLHGDFTTITEDDYGSVDLLVGGTPCQDYSGLGTRSGLNGERGSLALEFFRLAKRLKATWFVWKNVPNALKTNQGNDFKEIVNEVARCGFWWAYRIIDARNFHLSDQPRPRLFMVGYRGEGNRARDVLFKQCGVGWNKKKETSTAPVLTRNGAMALDDTTPVILEKSGNLRVATPLEYERAMGFPDNYTEIPYRNGIARKTPRYEALGNSMAVPVMRWIGEQISR